LEIDLEAMDREIESLLRKRRPRKKRAFQKKKKMAIKEKKYRNFGFWVVLIRIGIYLTEFTTYEANIPHRLGKQHYCLQEETLEILRQKESFL